MPLVNAVLDAYLLTSAITVIPWFYYALTLQRRSYNAGQGTNIRNLPQSHAQIQATRRVFLSVFIALHTLYILHGIIVCAPQNLFTLLHIPLNEPSDSIRARLLYPALPRTLENLLTRLQSFNVRTIYVRFGHSVVQECEHCSTFNDFALYALPRPLLEYAREAAVVGIVTIRDSGRERWRFWGLSATVAAALYEAYFLLSTDVSFAMEGRAAFMIHDTALLFRRLLFLLLPPLLHHLPSFEEPPSPLASLPQLTVLADQIVARVQLLRYTMGARARDPALRDAANAWWARQRSEGTWAIGDPALRDMAEKLGMGIDEEGPLRTRARATVEVLKGGFRPSDNTWLAA